MTIADLTLGEEKLLARKIRELVEPNGAATDRMTKEIELRRLILSEENIIVNGMAEICEILKSRYSDKTISRLISKIQKTVVLDCSICNLPTNDLMELIFNGTQNNLITSLTFDELLNLSKKPGKSKVDIDSTFNAHLLYMKILEDSTSENFTCVNIPKKTYVDTQLIEYCTENKYSLYTYDMLMGLRAKSHHIDVTIFNKIPQEKILHYEPSFDKDSKNIILDTDLLKTVTLKDVILAAKSINGAKFILTSDFVSSLEPLKETPSVKDFILFLANDISNESYSIYLNPKESSASIAEIAKKHNAIFFTSDINKCFSFRSKLFEHFKLVSTSETMFFLENASFHTSSTHASKKGKSIEKQLTNLNNKPKDCDDLIEPTIHQKGFTKQINEETNCFASIPYCSEDNCISKFDIPHSEKVWILDNTGSEISLKKKKNVKLDSGYTIIHGINKNTDFYEISVYNFIKQKNRDISILMFSTEFVKGTADCILPAYKIFAKRLIAET